MFWEIVDVKLSFVLTRCNYNIEIASSKYCLCGCIVKKAVSVIYFGKGDVYVSTFQGVIKKKRIMIGQI